MESKGPRAPTVLPKSPVDLPGAIEGDRPKKTSVAIRVDMGSMHALRAAADECGFKPSALARLLVVGWLISNNYLLSHSQEEITSGREFYDARDSLRPNG